MNLACAIVVAWCVGVHDVDLVQYGVGDCNELVPISPHVGTNAIGSCNLQLEDILIGVKCPSEDDLVLAGDEVGDVDEFFAKCRGVLHLCVTTGKDGKYVAGGLDLVGCDLVLRKYVELLIAGGHNEEKSQTKSIC